MKPIFNIALAVAALIFSTSVAVAGDKFTPKRDLPNEASRPTEKKFSSTTNEVSKPIERVKPEDAMDKALNSPVKLDSATNKDVISTKASEEKLPVHTTYKQKNANKKRKKHYHHTEHNAEQNKEKIDLELVR